MMNWRLLFAVIALFTMIPVMVTILGIWFSIQADVLPWSDSGWLKCAIISLIGLFVEIRIFPKAYREGYR